MKFFGSMLSVFKAVPLFFEAQHFSSTFCYCCCCSLFWKNCQYQLAVPVTLVKIASIEVKSSLSKPWKKSYTVISDLFKSYCLLSLVQFHQFITRNIGGWKPLWRHCVDYVLSMRKVGAVIFCHMALFVFWIHVTFKFCYKKE